MIRRRSPKAWAVVREASVRDVAGEDLVLVFQHAVHANMFEAQPELLLEALREVIGGTWQVRAELAGSPARPATAPAQAAVANSAGGRGRDADGDSDDEDDSDEEGGWPAIATPGAPTPNPPQSAANPATRVAATHSEDDDVANSVTIDDPPAEQAIQLLTEGLGAQRIAGPAG